MLVDCIAMQVHRQDSGMNWTQLWDVHKIAEARQWFGHQLNICSCYFLKMMAIILIITMIQSRKIATNFADLGIRIVH